MKITIEKEFTSVGEAAAWLQRIIEGTEFDGGLHGDVGELKPARKPRNDAGKPRGSYLEKAAAAKINEEAPVEATPTPLKPVAQPVRAPSVEQTPAVAAAPTKEDALAALKRMSLTAGFGTPACVAHLKEFKVTRLSELDPKHYPLFIKQIDDKLAAGSE